MGSIASVMNRDLAVAGPDESVAAAVERMGRYDLGALLVVAGGKLLGIFSERDVVRRVVEPGKDPVTTRVGQVATPAPVTVSPDTSIKECTRILREGGFRHLPVVDGEGKPVGILSARDFLGFVVAELESFIESSRPEVRREEMVDPYEFVGA